MLLMLLFIRARPTERRGGVSLGALREGISFVRSQPIILSLMILDFNANFFGSPKALLPVYARDLLQVGPQGLGILYAASSVGAIVSALAISVVGQPRKAGLGVIIGIVFYALCAMGFALSTSFGLSVLLLAGMGVGDALSAVLRSTINQLVTPDDLRGRMSAVNQLFTSSGPQLGQLESGVVASWWGAETAALTGGLATLLIATSVGFVPVLRRFRLPSAAVDPART
jgi:MFS family permease